MTMTCKKCKKCGIEQDISQFRERHLTCKKCMSIYQKQWYKDNLEHKKIICKRLYEKDKAKIKERHKKYNETHKQTVRQKIREWHQSVKRGEKGETRLLKIKVKCLIKNTIKGNFYSKTSKTANMLGCSYEELMTHLGPKPDGDYHLDHICPCAQAQNEEELIKLQHYLNLRWLNAEENLSKSDSKTPKGEEMCLKLLGREWRYE